jgi:hypothetical protein
MMRRFRPVDGSVIYLDNSSIDTLRMESNAVFYCINKARSILARQLRLGHWYASLDWSSRVM